MNPQFTQLFLMVVHPPAQKHASFCLAQETPLMLQSLQRTVNVTLQGGAMLMDKGRQGPLCVKDSKAKSCRSWTSGVTNVTMKIDDDIKMSPEFMNENECSCLPSLGKQILKPLIFHRFPSNFHHFEVDLFSTGDVRAPRAPLLWPLPGTEEGDNILYMFLLNVLTPAQEPLYDAWLQQTLQK